MDKAEVERGKKSADECVQVFDVLEDNVYFVAESGKGQTKFD